MIRVTGINNITYAEAIMIHYKKPSLEKQLSKM